MQNMTTNKDLRCFGLMVGGIFAVIGLWPVVWRGQDYRLSALALAALLIVPALVFPSSLKPVHKLWMKVGHVLGWINTRVLLGAVFFLVVTPMGMIRRLLGKDSMAKEPSRNLETYRVPGKPRPASHLTRQY
jgi:hypothetical protein